MRHLIIKNSLFFLCVYAMFTTAYAGIYKGTDTQGNVYFSDQPIPDSVEYKPSSISVVDSRKVETVEKTTDPKAENFKYTKFDIVSPVNNQIIRNESDISISLQIAPPLNVEQDHNVWLLMDGKPVVKNSIKMALSLGRIDRGAHQFQAQVKDGDGKIVARTRTVVAHIKYGAN